jgi:taurine dioxygenase
MDKGSSNERGKMATDVKATVVASPLSYRIGVKVSGVDFSLPLAPAVAKLLVELLDAHSLLLFRDVDVTPEAQIALLSEFGPVCSEFDDGKYFQYMSTVAEETPLSVHRLLYHQDGSHTQHQHVVNSLYGVEIDGTVAVPTYFASCRAAAAELTVEERSRWATLRAVHVNDVEHRMDESFSRTRLDLLEVLPPETTHPRTTHPVLKPHPRTGEKLVFITEVMTSHIEGMEPDESERLIQRAFGLLFAPSNTYVHRWQEKDLLVWDNYALEHARGKPVPGSRRKMRRVVVNPVQGATGRAAIRLNEEVIRAGELQAARERERTRGLNEAN